MSVEEPERDDDSIQEATPSVARPSPLRLAVFEPALEPSRFTLKVRLGSAPPDDDDDDDFGP